jgi:hypothetical protein
LTAAALAGGTAVFVAFMLFGLASAASWRDRARAAGRLQWLAVFAVAGTIWVMTVLTNRDMVASTR